MNDGHQENHQNDQLNYFCKLNFCIFVIPLLSYGHYKKILIRNMVHLIHLALTYKPHSYISSISCKNNCVISIDHSPFKAFLGHIEAKNSNRLRWRQSNKLCASANEDLNQGFPGTYSAGGQSLT